MGFVDRDHGRRASGAEAGELRGLQPLGRHVEQDARALSGPLKGGVLLGGGKGAVDEGGADARGVQGAHLVGHQRDERRHYQREAHLPLGLGALCQAEGRHLVAHRFARARGHHGEHVAAVEQGIDNLLLVGAEGIVAEAPLENRTELKGVGGGFRSH